MQNNDITLSVYKSLFTAHIVDVVKFNTSTNDWLDSSQAADLFFQDAGKRILKQELGLNEISTSQKILMTIKEIADQSKAYLARLDGYSVVLKELIKAIAE